jgi:FKBP-type peptidyl-prolyl cis-trans isomerase SlyD
MKVEKDRVVTLEYKLSTAKGALIESSVGRGAPVAFIHGRGFMLPGLDARLDGMEPGERKTFELPPEEAFGTIEQQQTNWLPRKEFPSDAAQKVGAKFQAKLPQSNLQITLEVIEVENDRLKVRMIHPYAGKTINFEVEVVSVRAASPKELATGVVEAVPTKKGTAPPPPPPKDVASLEELDVEPDDEEGGEKAPADV